MTVGTELRQARERAGLTAREISDRTKIQLYKVAALERDDYDVLPQGIYLDGIVRAYARELGLPDGPLVERARLESGTVPGDVPDRNELAPSAHIILDGSRGNEALDWFKTEHDLAPVTTARHELKEPEHQSAAPRPTHQRSRFAVPLLGALAAVGMGLFVYQRQTPSEDRPRVTAESETTTPTQKDAAPPPFTENVIAPPDPDEKPEAEPSAPPRDTPVASKTTARSTDSVADAAPPAAARSRPAETSIPEAVPSGPESGGAPASAADLTGAWTVATQIESSSLARYEGLQLGYEMRLTQRGDRVTGVGRKVTENGAGIGRRAQTAVTVTGSIRGDRLLLNFVEKGTRRSTQGRFELLIDQSGTLRGSFSSTAARSSGRVEAHRKSVQ